MSGELEKFLDERKNMLPIPDGPVARINLLTEELALGVHIGLWSRNIGSNFEISDPTVKEFLNRRWRDIGDLSQIFDLLVGYDYIRLTDAGVVSHPLTRLAFDLLRQIPPYNVFISCRRKDSSALALLISHRLQHFNLMPFVDMAVKVGDNWYDELHKRIKDCDYFIILLGRNTLKSEMTVQEIRWAMQYREQNREEDIEEKKIIPLWHSGFNLQDEKWAETDKEVKVAIQQTNAIIVHNESASGYNTAIVELLNRFGITP